MQRNQRFSKLQAFNTLIGLPMCESWAPTGVGRAQLHAKPPTPPASPNCQGTAHYPLLNPSFRLRAHLRHGFLLTRVMRSTGKNVLVLDLRTPETRIPRSSQPFYATVQYFSGLSLLHLPHRAYCCVFSPPLLLSSRSELSFG